MSDNTVQEVEYVTTTRLGEKGQLTIPKEFRDSLGLEPGSPISVVRAGSGLMLFAEQARFKEICDRVADLFAETTSPGGGALEGILTIIANQERIIANQERILTNQEKILAK